MTDVASTEADWLAWRAGGIGSSDVAAAYTGIYGGAYKAVASRIGIEVDEISGDLAARGHRWETAVADGVHAHTGLYVAGEQMWLEAAANNRHRATPDGLLIPAPEASPDDLVAGLETKTRAPSAPWRWDYWLTQPQWAMYVAGVDRWLLAIATIDTEFDPTTGALTEYVADVRYRWVYADPYLQSQLVELADWLLDHIDRGVLPDPNDAAALPYVKAANDTVQVLDCPNCGGSGEVEDDECVLCGGDGVEIVDADIDELTDLISRYDTLKAAAKKAKEEADRAEAIIRDRMGGATEAHTTDGKWRVRCGVPIAKFTDRSEADFIDQHCTHRHDCPPDCTEHRPDLLIASLYRDLAKDEMPDEYEACRFKTADRRLTIKNMET